MNNILKKTVIGGLIGTAFMTALMIMAPMMGMPKMPIGKMLAGFMHIPVTAGWIMHFVIGTIIAAGYVVVFESKLPGNSTVKGIIYAIIPFLMAQLMVMPMMGAGIFSSHTQAPVMMVMGSFIGHVVYGAVLGFVSQKVSKNN